MPKPKNEYDHSEQFSTNWVITHPELEAAALELATSCSTKAAPSDKETTTAKALIANLLYLYRKDPSLYLAISRDNNAYKKASMYNFSGVTTALLTRFTEALAEDGYIDIKPGFNDPRSGKSFRTRINSSKKLIKVFNGSVQNSVSFLYYC